MLVNLIEIHPRNAVLLSRDQWADMLDRGIIRRYGKQVRAVLGRPGRFFKRKTIARTRAYYLRQGFNSDGDMVAHLKAPAPKMNEREFRFRYNEQAVAETIAELNRFADDAAKRGAKTWFSHPPLPEPVFAANRGEVDKLDAAFAAELKMPQLDRAEELVFPYDCFFDTWYHLAAPGVEKRTQLLAARMTQQAKRFAEAGTAH